MIEKLKNVMNEMDDYSVLLAVSLWISSLNKDEDTLYKFAFKHDEKKQDNDYYFAAMVVMLDGYSSVNNDDDDNFISFLKDDTREVIIGAFRAWITDKNLESGYIEYYRHDPYLEPRFIISMLKKVLDCD